METKICSKCYIEKDLADFGKKITNKDGLQSRCKECRKIQMRLYDKERRPPRLYKQDQKEYMKEYNKLRSEKMKIYNAARRKKKKEAKLLSIDEDKTD